MNILNRFIFFIAFLLLVNSCKEKVFIPSEQEDPEVIEVTSLVFKKELNPKLSSDIVLKEENGKYTAKIIGNYSKNLVLTFESNASKVLIDTVAQVSGISERDFADAVKYTFLGTKEGKKEIIVHVLWERIEIPHISINIDGGQEVTSKEVYLKANLDVDGNNLYPSFQGTTEIRGRGNSTWGYPKKPYRLKLTTKSEILGLPAARNWVLLANYLDPSLMCNAVAMKIGKDLELPFTNNIIPVDLTVNGTYRGSYMLTEQVEVGENRVNIGADGVLLELDANYDEDYKFRSANFSIPVMLKFPDLSSNNQFVPIRNDFQNLESLIASPDFPNTNYADLLDINILAKFLLVYYITGNEEINHPKSTYLHKKVGGKYTFGPIWDFDWAYGYESGRSHFTNPNRPLFITPLTKGYPGTRFFVHLQEDPRVKAALKTEWENYKQNKLNKLIEFVDEYASLISDSKAKDTTVWNIRGDFETLVVRLKAYLQNRATYLDSYFANL